MSTRMNCRVVAIASLLLIPGVASAASQVEGTLTTSEPIEVEGSSSWTTTRGVAHASPADFSSTTITLQAEVLQLNYSWERGVQAGAEGSDPALRHQTDAGREERTLRTVRANVTPFRDRPEILAIATDQGARIQADGQGSVRSESIRDAYLTRVGSSDAYQDTGGGDWYGFWYKVNGPWLAGQNLDSVLVEGDFDLFINNVTLQVSSAEDGNLTHWTGREVSSGPAPGVQEVERRITVLSVENGTLWVSSQDEVLLAGPDATARSDGTVTTDAADGALHTEDRRLIYQRAAVGLQGEGSLDLTALPAGATAGGAESKPADETSAVTEVHVAGDFTPRITPGVEVSSTASEQSSWRAGMSWAPWLGVLLLIGAVAFGARDRVLGWYTARKASRRRERVQRWRRVGDEAFQAREYEDALSWFERIVEHYPNSLEGWNSVASCLEELERYEEALDAYLEAASMMEEDVRVLVDAAGCAWRADRDEQAVALAVTVAEHDPGRLGRLSGPAFQGLREHPEVQKALGRDLEPVGQSYV